MKTQKLSLPVPTSFGRYVRFAVSLEMMAHAQLVSAFLVCCSSPIEIILDWTIATNVFLVNLRQLSNRYNT